MFAAIYNKLSFSVMLLIAEFLLCFRFPKRKFFVPLAILGCLPVLACAYFWGDIVNTRNMWISASKYLVIFIFSFAMMALAFKGDFWAYLFVGVMSYCVQHISYRLCRLILLLTELMPTIWLEIVVLIAVSIPIYAAITFFFSRQLRKGEVFKVNNKIQIILSALILVLTIYLSSFGVRFVHDKNGVIVLLCYSFVSCVFAMFLEFAFLKMKKDEAALMIMNHMVHAAKNQLNDSKESIEVINVKCHDLRHQLASLRGKVDQEELDKIADAVDIYDSTFETGNDALDVVLTEKSLLCKNKNVRLTCMVNGKNLSAIKPSDIYSFFGNAIENALDSVEKLVESKRVISISEIKRGDFLDIRMENYFDGTIEFEDGLPVTKKDKRYHGFGVKSMRMIAEKYGGVFSVTIIEDIFRLDMLLPICKQVNN